MGAPTDHPVRDFPRCSNHAARERIVIVHAPAWRADARRSCMVAEIAPISMQAAFVIADRRLDLTPNQGLSRRVRLRSSRHNDVALVGEGLPRLLPQRGETIGQAIEIVIIV